MKYQSKKDPTIFAELEKKEEKYGTVQLKLLTGDNMGKSISITNSTLKRWWKATEVENPETTDKIPQDPKDLVKELNIDVDKINEPYKPDVTPHYIPKPQSVIEYEERKNKKFNLNLPKFEDIVEDLGLVLKKVNNNSSYVMFTDKSTLWRKSGFIDVYATSGLGEELSVKGFTSKPNNDKDRPFAFRLTTIEDYNKFVEAIKCMTL